MKIIMIASECVPYAKTGGLADVVGALPKALKAMGHDVHIIIPKYASIDARKFGLKPYHRPMGVWMGGVEEWCSVDRAPGPGGAPVYFIEHNGYFGREGIYNNARHQDYADNPRRFAFFTRAALQFLIDRGIEADIVHLHDWPTATAAAYLKTWFRENSVLGGTASVLTIHNIAHQGKYGRDHYPYTGLGWNHFTPDKFEDMGHINYLKGGIHFADMVTTVSPNYAEETRTAAMGEGLGPQLKAKGEAYLGILNGVDYEEWNPETDPLIPARYSAADLSGKAICKAALQQHLGLEINPNIPLFGVVSRFAAQKGLDLLYPAIHTVLKEMLAQFIILGSGDKGLESKFIELPALYPGRVGSFIGYNNELSHWIEAGSDFFIMPSRFEPCGLNQMYSLRYGALPIVHATGGLVDSVEQYDEYDGAGTGFLFWDASPGAIHNTIGWAVSTYFDRREHMAGLIQNAMRQRFSWERSAEAYVKVYEQARQRHKPAGAV